MRSVLLQLLAFCVLAHAVTVEFNACSSDVDCEPSNAICFDGLGPTDQRRCMCQFGYTWDSLNHRCDLPTYVINSSMVVVTRQTPLYYAEQLTQASLNVLSFTRGRSVLPSQWYCDRTTQFCSALDTTLGIEVANFNYSLVANTSFNSSSVPGVQQYWRCTNSKATRLNDNMIMNVTAASLGYGMRPLWEYCPSCSVWCQQGTCSANNQTCACNTGWQGTRCDQQTTLVRLNRYDATRSCTFTNETSACGLHEQCYIHSKLSLLAGRLRGVCWCQIGYVPDTSSAWGGGCLPSAVASVPSVLVDFAPNNATQWRYFNATYTTALPQYAWTQDAVALYATRGPATTGLADPAWRVVSSLPDNLLLERCLSLAPRFFFFRPEFLTFTSSIVENKHRWCEYGGGVAACGHLGTPVDAWNGTCECDEGVTGRYCTTCVGDWTGPTCSLASRAACRTTYCHGRGDCVDGQPLGTCVCDRPYLADTACAVSAVACGQANCSAHGECLDSQATACACDTGYKGARCSITDAACRVQRCSSRGACSSEVQGCTCDPFQMRSNCSRTYCAYDQPLNSSSNSCVCNSTFIGTHCETRRCGLYGDYSVAQHKCQCVGVMSPNTINGSCTRDICNYPRGYSVSGRWCTCYPGNRRVENSAVAQCQKPCSAYGVYNASTDQCLCQIGFSGDLCNQKLSTRLPVPRDYTLLINWSFTALLGLFVLLNLWVPHIRLQHTHIRMGPPDSVRDTLMTRDGTLLQ